MERRKSSRGPGAAPRKRPKVDIARTALGAIPEKRGLKPEALAGLDAPKKAAASGQRELAVKVKTAKQRTVSSTHWLQRQLNDPYVARAKSEGYRSRAAYKLLEMDEKFALLTRGARIVDLGCAPGGWLQVAAKKSGAGARIVGIDYLDMPGIPGTEFLKLDFLDPSAPQELKRLLGGEADLVLSDMAAPTSGHKTTDHLRIIGLAEAALDFAEDVLAPGGSFVCKVFQGGTEGALLARLKKSFETVKHSKPRASRTESAEVYVVATGFRKNAGAPL